jgi:hypothetical protein
MSSPRRFMAIYDAHSGWDRRLERGEWVSRPTFTMAAWRAAVRFAQEFCPTTVIYGGDQLNCGPISHWHKGRPILDEGFRLKDEMDYLEQHLLEPLETVAGKAGKFVWLTGNHEQWILEHVSANPGLMGMVEPECYLGLKDKKYHIYSQGEIYRDGKLNFVHGDVVFKRGAGVNPALTLVSKYRRNIRCGHIHSFSSASLSTAIDAKDYHTGVVVPALSSRNPAYNQTMPNNHLHGFLWGYIWPDGTFNDSVAIINNGKVTYNGKLIDGNKK